MMSGFVDEGRAVDTVYFHISKAFSIVSQDILVEIHPGLVVVGNLITIPAFAAEEGPAGKEIALSLLP